MTQDRIARIREWQRNNPEKRKAAVNKYAAKNLDRIKQWAKDNPDKRKAIQKKYVETKPEKRKESATKYYETHKQECLERSKTYRKNNQDKVRAWKYQRRARENNAAGKANPKQIAERVEVFGGLCWVCKQPYEDIDHVIPLSKGGTNYPANLRPICHKCNVRKSDQNWKTFLRGVGL